MRMAAMRMRRERTGREEKEWRRGSRPTGGAALMRLNDSLMHHQNNESVTIFFKPHSFNGYR
jgi:hypothetical protein